MPEGGAKAAQGPSLLWRGLAACMSGLALGACAPGPALPSVMGPSATTVAPSPAPEGSLAAALAQAAALEAGRAFDLLATFGPETKLGWFALIHGYAVVLEAKGLELASRPPQLRVLPTHPEDFSLRPDAPATDGVRFANHVRLRFPTGDLGVASEVGQQLSAWGPIQRWAFVAGPLPQASPAP